eukprot:m.128969 g.128969  ORF g.128969 m.128969 type:complete len:85 (+) comp17451_c0_seq1:165-419(+)
MICTVPRPCCTIQHYWLLWMRPAPLRCSTNALHGGNKYVRVHRSAHYTTVVRWSDTLSPNITATPPVGCTDGMFVSAEHRRGCC